jgi:peptidoglycan/xylan/chitin deacetylase (PgdA/CDA1 family)
LLVLFFGAAFALDFSGLGASFGFASGFFAIFFHLLKKTKSNLVHVQVCVQQLKSANRFWPDNQHIRRKKEAFVLNIPIRTALCAALAILMPGKVLAGGAAAACWSADSLMSRASERAIRHAPYSAPPFATNPAAGESLPSLPQNFRGSIRRVELPPGKKLVALTFDLCENANEVSGYDGAIIDILRSKDVKATFFPSGKWLFDHEERAQQLLADPLFQVGAHSWTHWNYRLLTPQEVAEDLQLDLKADAETRGKLQSRACYAESAHVALPRLSIFRFPFGTCTAENMRAVNDAGLLAIQWDVVSGDPAPAQTADKIRHGVVAGAKPGSIIIMHANGRGHHTAEALPLVIDDLRAKGFEFETVSGLLAQGRPVVADSCYENKPGDNVRYDKLFALRPKGPLGSPSEVR